MCIYYNLIIIYIYNYKINSKVLLGFILSFVICHFVTLYYMIVFQHFNYVNQYDYHIFQIHHTYSVLYSIAILCFSLIFNTLI